MLFYPFLPENILNRFPGDRIGYKSYTNTDTLDKLPDTGVTVLKRARCRQGWIL